MAEDTFIPEGMPDEGRGDGRTVIAGPGAPDFLDLTQNADLIDKVRRHAADRFERLRQQRQDRDELEETADYMFACGLNDDIRASKQPGYTQANTGDTLFYRQVRQLAAQTLSILLSSKNPYRHKVLPNDEEPYSEEEADAIVNQRNNLDRYTRKEDGFERKMIDGVTSLTKRGTCFWRISWLRKTATRLIKTPRKREIDGEKRKFDWEKREVVVCDRPTLEQIPNLNVYCDRNAGDDLDRHNMVVVTDLESIDDLWNGVKEGRYNADAVAQVNKSHLYEGSDASKQNDNREQEERNRGLQDETDEGDLWDDTSTGLFETFEVWLKTPVTSDGEWDEEKTIPTWHVFKYVHDIEHGPCIQAQDNYEPDGELPIKVINRNPDDHDSVYHISDAAVLAPNFHEKTLRKNQMFDNLETINKRPLKAVRGEVHTKDLSYGQHKVLWVEREGALTEMDVRDTTGTCIQVLEHVDRDSNRAVGADDPIMGTPLGGRTSATEADEIIGNAKGPHLIIARYILGDLLGWVGRKFQRFWEVFGDHDRVIQIVEGDEIIRIDLGQIWGDFDTEVTVLDTFEGDLISDQNMTHILQSVVPNFLDVTDKRALASKVYKHFGMEPAELISNVSDIDAERVAQERIMAMFEDGREGYESPQPGENLKVHLSEAQGFLLKYKGVEDQFPNLMWVEQYTAEVKFLMNQQNQQLQQQAPMQAPPGNETPGEVVGNQLAAQNAGPGY